MKSSFPRATAVLFGMQIGRVLRSRRTLVGLGLAAVPPLITAAALRFGPDLDPREILALVSFFLSLQVIVPILSLVGGSAVVTEEVENRTITYLFTRPISRVAFFVGRWLATATVVCGLLGLSAAIVVLLVRTRGDAVTLALGGRFVWASVAGGLVYSLVFAVLGIFLRRPMIVGLGYAFAFEGVLANAPGGSQSLALQYYLRSIALDPALDVWREIGGFVAMGLSTLESPWEATRALSIVALVALLVGGFAISRRQYVLTS